MAGHSLRMLCSSDGQDVVLTGYQKQRDVAVLLERVRGGGTAVFIDWPEVLLISKDPCWFCGVRSQ